MVIFDELRKVHLVVKSPVEIRNLRKKFPRDRTWEIRGEPPIEIELARLREKGDAAILPYEDQLAARKVACRLNWLAPVERRVFARESWECRAILACGDARRDTKREDQRWYVGTSRKLDALTPDSPLDEVDQPWW